MSDQRRKTLGRGLSALFGEETQDLAALDRVRQVKNVAIGALKPGRFQPRRVFDDESLQPLAESVAEKGILQAILVRRLPEDPNRYEIIAGERRWRAAQIAKLHEVPVVVRELDDQAVLEVALIENIQRQDLTAIEEAEAYERLMSTFGHTQDAVAKAVGKSRSHVANLLRLLELPDSVKTMVNQGKLSAGHARALVGASDPEALAERATEEGLNVREIERLASEAKPETGQGRRPAKAKPEKDPDTLALERDLTTQLGLKVEIAHGTGGGSLTIHYRTLDQLDEVLRRLKP